MTWEDIVKREGNKTKPLDRYVDRIMNDNVFDEDDYNDKMAEKLEGYFQEDLGSSVTVQYVEDDNSYYIEFKHDKGMIEYQFNKQGHLKKVKDE